MASIYDKFLGKLRQLDEVAATTWASITGKPITFPPEAHNQAISTVTGLQTALDGKQASLTNPITGIGTASQVPSFTGVGSQTTPLNVEEIPYGFNLSAYSNQSYYYDLTNAAAAITFNTVALQVALNRVGSWKLSAAIVLEYVGATFAANQTVSAKLRRTNNTASDITNSNHAPITLDIVTTKTGVICCVSLPVVVYATINNNDILQLFANLSELPSAGSVRVKSAFILAEFLY